MRLRDFAVYMALGLAVGGPVVLGVGWLRADRATAVARWIAAHPAPLALAAGILVAAVILRRLQDGVGGELAEE